MDNDKVVDVACDHALLSIYIYLNKKGVKVISSDINELPLMSAKENIKKYNLENKIDVRLSDGLKNIKNNEFDTIIIAGLGGKTIVDILNDDINKTMNAKKIIIQANNNIYNVRKFLTQNKYKIVDEKIIKENNVISIIILFEKVRKKVKYTKHELILGPILIKEKNSLFKELIKKELIKKQKILTKIPNKYFIKRRKISKFINKINTKLRL